MSKDEGRDVHEVPRATRAQLEPQEAVEIDHTEPGPLSQRHLDCSAPIDGYQRGDHVDPDTIDDSLDTRKIPLRQGPEREDGMDSLPPQPLPSLRQLELHDEVHVLRRAHETVSAHGQPPHQHAFLGTQDTGDTSGRTKQI